MNKKGVSPVVATVLLIAIVVVLALIIFFWLRGFIGETVVKFDMDIAQACERVSFSGDYSSGTIYITNTGDVPIYRMKIKTYSSGSHSTNILSAEEGWNYNTGLKVGDSVEISKSMSSYDKFKLIPVLIGEGKNGKTKTYTCKEDYGIEINLS